MVEFLIVCCLCILLALGSSRVFDGIRARCKGTGATATAMGSTPVHPAAVTVTVPARDEQAFCLCNQCEQAPACSLRFPECVRGPAAPLSVDRLTREQRGEP